MNNYTIVLSHIVIEVNKKRVTPSKRHLFYFILYILLRELKNV